MIFHLSIAAEDPVRVAGVISELWGGEARMFPPVGNGSAVAWSGDDNGTTVEVYAVGTQLVPSDGDADASAVVDPHASRLTATHAAISTQLSEAEVHAIAKREGWQSKYRNRGGHFGVIELWLENTILMEVLTSQMQDEYRSLMTGSGPPWPRADRGISNTLV